MSVRIKKDRFALGSYQYGKYPLSYFLDTAQLLGFTQVELWAAAPHFCPEIMTVKECGAVKKQLNNRNLQVCCMTPEQCNYPVNLAAEECGLREASVSYFKAAMDVAQELECRRLLVTSGYGYYNQPVDDAWKRAEESLYKLAEYAKKKDIHLMLETLTPLSSNLVNTPEEQREMIKEMPPGSMSAMLDIGQMAYMGQELSRYLAHGSLLQYVHLQDSHPAIHMALGDGDLPLETYLEQIEEGGYRGYYGFEFNDARYRENPRAADIRSLKWLENHGILSE